MEFVRSIAEKVTVLHEGKLLAEGPMEKVQRDPKVDRGLPGNLTMLHRRQGQSVLRREPHPVGRDLDLQPGACTCLMGRNGVGKTTC